MDRPPPRVLVVDDNDALRENLVEALELEGYSVAEAADGGAALELLGREPLPHVVLLDLMMPGVDGATLAAAIRTEPRWRGVRVILTTGLSGAQARAGANADGVLMKPFGVKELLAALRKVGAG